MPHETENSSATNAKDPGTFLQWHVSTPAEFSSVPANPNLSQQGASSYVAQTPTLIRQPYASTSNVHTRPPYLAKSSVNVFPHVPPHLSPCGTNNVRSSTALSSSSFAPAVHSPTVPIPAPFQPLPPTSNYRPKTSLRQNTPTLSSPAEATPKFVLEPVPQTPKIPTSTPPPFQPEWNSVVYAFLRAAGLTQALRGFEQDMVVMNTEWEEETIPSAVHQLMEDLQRLHLESCEKKTENDAPSTQSVLGPRPLDTRKLDYVHLANGSAPRSPSSLNRSISQFLAKNRSRSDASNRKEFLQSLSEKRLRLTEAGVMDVDSDASPSSPSSARVDAKTIDRDLQMKYDIARNEHGPLRRTLRNRTAPNTENPPDSDVKGKQRATSAFESLPNVPTAERHPGLDDRLTNVERHLAVRYVPSPPRSLLDRLKFLEEHIINLEKEFPPWAALHFNQPHRGWPPPPRTTPIIVPSHLTVHQPISHSDHPPDNPNLSLERSSTLRNPQISSETTYGAIGPPSTPTVFSASKQKGKAKASSLHQAVLEKLEVQRAMNDLAGRKVGGSS